MLSRLLAVILFDHHEVSVFLRGGGQDQDHVLPSLGGRAVQTAETGEGEETATFGRLVRGV